MSVNNYIVTISVKNYIVTISVNNYIVTISVKSSKKVLKVGGERSNIQTILMKM